MNGKILRKGNERGSATVIALLVLALLLVFVAISVSRTTSETLATANDTMETRAFTAAEASLENMTQQFDAIFDFQLSPSTTDITNIEDSDPPNFPTYDFNNNVEQIENSKQVVISGGLLQGLYATRDAWRLTTIAKDTSTGGANGVEVELRRTFFNDRVPIFQFGIFYDDDLEFHPGPRFDFGGRVHSNGNLFLAANTGLYFSSRVSAHKEVLTDVGRNGRNAKSQWGENVWVRDGSGTYQQLKANMGSALKDGGTGGNLFFDDTDMPAVYRNSNWSIPTGRFDGNLMALQKNIQLPIKLATQGNADYIELIKRGKLVGDLWNDGTGTASAPSIVPVTAEKADNEIFAISRYANKAGIRVSLADSKAKLPGCVTGTGQAVATVCGVRLDGDKSGNGADPAAGESRGYEPKPMIDGYQATRLNGERFRVPGREVWIKIELVSFDQATKLPATSDVTADILSLGVTDPAPRIFEGSTRRFEIQNPLNYHSSGVDSRSIIQLQRFVMSGAVINSSSNWTSSDNWNGTDYNYVVTNQQTIPTPTPNPLPTPNPNPDNVPGVDTGFADHRDHKKLTYIDDNKGYRWIVPFPIKMFDTREGVFNDDVDPTGGAANRVTRNGVMSLLEINVGNLRRFLNGDFNSNMPTGTKFADGAGRALRSSDVPESNGWVLYISDRRGDRDFDGEYDMEDIYGPCDNKTQPGEDVDKNGLERDFKTAINPQGEAPNCSETDDADMSAVVDHSYFRRGVRLVNGETLPGNYIANSLDTTGFTVASENAVYVQGNYNATGVSSYGTPTPADDYLPQDTASHIPASVVGDAVIILSRGWRDARSFRYPFSLNDRPAEQTTVRFAMISGDAKSSFENTPNQGGGDPRLAGGVHNFKRFLENWGGDYLNYSGSLINLYNARNNNGAFKCCNKIYSPPNRNWTFDTSFLSSERLPPGTPFFQVIQLTGFQRVNN